MIKLCLHKRANIITSCLLSIFYKLSHFFPFKTPTNECFKLSARIHGPTGKLYGQSTLACYNVSPCTTSYLSMHYYYRYYYYYCSYFQVDFERKFLTISLKTWTDWQAIRPIHTCMPLCRSMCHLPKVCHNYY